MANNKLLQLEVSQQTLENLLKVHGEGDNLDFKQIFSLSSQQAKAELVRDILAFANTKGGGHIIFGVKDEGYTLLGLPPIDSLPKSDRQIDTTTIYHALEKYLPTDLQFMAAEYEIQWPEWPGKRRFGILYIPKYRGIAMAKCDVSHHHGKRIIVDVKESDILVRRGAQSCHVDPMTLKRLMEETNTSRSGDIEDNNKRRQRLNSGSKRERDKPLPLTTERTMGKVKVLFLAANPKDSSQLRLDEEMRAIDLALRQAEFRDIFDISQHWAVRVADIQGYLLRHQPDIVHFSGHGSESNEIILEDSNGNSHAVSPRTLSSLFSALKDNIRCVVLNACYSEQQAQAIAKHIECVIGMSKAIGDAAAISFAAAFYQALGYGRSVKTAFVLGCIQIDLDSLDEQDTPKLLAINSTPESILFV